MKFIKVFCFGFIFISILFAQEQEKSFIEVAYVINIEVPVRVFEKGEFVDNLTMADFEIFEDGKPQDVLAVYRIKQNFVQKREEKERFIPHTKRLFILFFELATYDPRLGDAVDYFIKEVLLSSDDLIAVTPIKTYKLENKELLIKPREDVANELKELIRKDVMIGNSESRSSQQDIIEIARELRALLTDQNLGPFEGERIEPLITAYTAAIDKLEFIRDIDQLKLLDFANYLKTRPEQKYVFLFYEKEYMPRIDTKLWTQLSSLYQNMGGIGLDHSIADYHDYYNQEVTIDLESVGQAYADAAASLHFLFISKPTENIPGIDFVERANDVFSTFAEMSKSSGGFVDSSSRPDTLFQAALDASENYYLLYYAPKEYVSDGKFKEIKVKVKGKDYKVVHRLGYFSN